MEHLLYQYHLRTIHQNPFEVLRAPFRIKTGHFETGYENAFQNLIMSKRKKKEHIIFVHGTFAADESDTGQAWWQNGSAFYNYIKSNLGKQYSVNCSNNKAFHWSGENTMLARRQGAQKLMKLLAGYDAKGEGYHLVGHSHGGSLIWTAISMSTLDFEKNVIRKKVKEINRLKGLKSFITVGSPFILFENRNKYLSRLRAKYWKFFIASSLFYFTPFIYVFLCTFGVTKWNFYLIPFYVIFMIIHFILTSICLNIKEIAREILGETYAEILYAEKWHGLNCSKDEAFNSLNIAKELNFEASYSIGPQYPGSMAFGFTQNLLRNIYGKYIFPWFKEKLANYLKKLALGFDRPYYRNDVMVSMTPFENSHKKVELLSNEVESELLNKALDYMKCNAEDIWQKMYSIRSFNNLLSMKESLAFTGKELIHTSYFDNDEVRKKIVSFIRSKQ